ncbi:MAG: gentisate 1,2-dioxygenase [Betaproteobacteria bacterium RBG_16_66_20]|nr:MAG: gentisate 1,2-dioxygenase [Betaproteobacteria bacterium RBG_16_66_20]
MASVPKPGSTGPDPASARQEFYRRMDRDNLAPLWEVLHALVLPQPQSPCKPGYWNYKAIRPYIMEAGRAISAKEAVRRVLILENPGLRGQSCITRSLYCGLQLILPGEIAPSHRHTQSALRFIVEGAGAYTAVNGERTTMHPGDFIITPAWTWHDHGNPGTEPVVWMDGLDIPILALFDAQFAENYTADVQPVTRNEGSSFASYGNNLAPLDPVAPFGKASPIFSYPYARSRETLAALAKNGAPDPCHGWKMQFINPLSGAPAMPTIGAFIQLLPKGFRSSPYRSTDSTVYSVAEGTGKVKIANEEFAFQPRDTFVVPSWHAASLEAGDECVLFSYSDRPAQLALGLWREHRG